MKICCDWDPGWLAMAYISGRVFCFVVRLSLFFPRWHIGVAFQQFEGKYVEAELHLCNLSIALLKHGLREEA